MANGWLDQILRYENESAKRSLPVDSNLESAIRSSVLSVYGDGYTVSIISGGQGEGSNGITGSRRHTTKGAADVYVYDPSGKRLSPDQLVPLGQHWASSKIGGVGFPANGQSMHLDIIGGTGKGAIPLKSGEGMIWYYGRPTAAQKAALTGGQFPKYAIDPGLVAKGVIPPGSIPNTVGTQLDVFQLAEKIAPEPKPRIQGTAARTNAALQKQQRESSAPKPAPAQQRDVARGLTQPSAITVQKNEQLQQRKDKGQGGTQKAPALLEVLVTASAPAAKVKSNIDSQREEQLQQKKAQTAKAVTPIESKVEAKVAPTPKSTMQQKAAKANAALQSSIQLGSLLDDGIATTQVAKLEAGKIKGGAAEAKNNKAAQAEAKANGTLFSDKDTSNPFSLGGVGNALGKMFGLDIKLGGSGQKGAQGGNGHNTRSDSGASVYRPESGYGSKGYSTITSPGGTHQYDRDSGSWQSTSGKSSESSHGMGSSSSTGSKNR